MSSSTGKHAASPSAGVAALAAEPSGPAQKLALIIPTLNEAGNVKALLERIRMALEPLDIPYEVMIVDDDSRDGIASIVDAIAREYPRLRLITRLRQRGLAGAVLYGWRNTDAAILGVMDADLQHPPELLPQLWEEMARGVDVVVASRYARGGSLGQWNAARRFVSAAAIWVTVPLQKPSIRAQDPMSGFFLLRRSCLGNLELQTSGYKLLLEILVRGRVQSVTEVPFEFGLRNAGKSKASFRVALNYLKLLLRLYKARFLDHRDAFDSSVLDPALVSDTEDRLR